MKKIVIFGANSAVAKACARLWAEQGHELFLVARDGQKLGALVQDLKVRSQGRIGSQTLDLNDLDAHKKALESAKEALNGYDCVFIAHGILGDQSQLQKSFAATQEAMQVNLLSPLSLLTLAANELEALGRGHIGVITSVAGDRGRQSNYIYGMCKGALSIFLSGLRNRLAKKGVHVSDFRMGFVDSPMTRHITKKGLLWKQPDAVGRVIVRKMDGTGGIHYVPGFWRLIMFVIRSIPDKIFRRLSL